jgi:predicted transcriptional regulator of viral defense system
MADQLTDSDLLAMRRIKALGGVVRTAQALRAGVHPRSFYRLRDLGHLEPLSRGLYRLAATDAPSLPDLLVVAARLPKAVLCLTSALSFHELTEEIPHEVHVALPRGSEQPRIEHPPLRVVRVCSASFGAGVEKYDVDGFDLRVYEPAKAVVDCFKFRSLVGTDTALAGLKRLMSRRGFDVERILGFARTCRVERVIRPYVEALL